MMGQRAGGKTLGDEDTPPTAGYLEMKECPQPGTIFASSGLHKSNAWCLVLGAYADWQASNGLTTQGTGHSLGGATSKAVVSTP